MFKKLGIDLHDREVDKIIEKVDVDNDGEISYDEFKELYNL